MREQGNQIQSQRRRVRPLQASKRRERSDVEGDDDTGDEAIGLRRAVTPPTAGEEHHGEAYAIPARAKAQARDSLAV